MKTEWIKAIITQLIALFLFIALNAEIMGWFDVYILPTLSSMNEGPIYNIQDKISAVIQKYRAETIDIEDVEFEEVDLELDTLFPLNNEVVNTPTDN